MMKRLLIALFSPLAFAADYPETVVTPDYTFPPLGQYSVPGVGQAIHADDAPSVTLGNGETLNAAAARLKVLSGGKGGRIKIAWDTDTVQCDRLRNAGLVELTITGIPGPGGKLPRFYCLDESRGGTIPKSGAGGEWVMGATSGPSGKLLVEHVEVAGYKKWIQFSQHQKSVVRNAIFYGARVDGFGNSKTQTGDTKTADTVIEFAGVKVSHSGQGNASHCFYMHRGNEYSDVRVTLVDSEVSSCNWSSGFKSIAEHNFISGTKFYKYKDIPGLPRRYTGMMIDIAACGWTTVENSEFHMDRPDRTTPDGAMIGVRNRKGIYGCDIPVGWSNDYVTLADGSRQWCERNPMLPECQRLDSDFWKPSYWASLNGEKIFPFNVRNNLVAVKPGGFKADRAVFIASNGTYPNYTYTLGGWACPLVPPTGWYERSMVYVNGNTYSGIVNKSYLFNNQPVGLGHPTRCLPAPPFAHVIPRDLITVGPNEVFK